MMKRPSSLMLSSASAKASICSAEVVTELGFRPAHLAGNELVDVAPAGLQLTQRPLSRLDQVGRGQRPDLAV